MCSYTWRQILWELFQEIKDPSSFLEFLWNDLYVIPLNWCMSPKVVYDSSKIIQYRIQLKPKTVRTLLFVRERIFPSEINVDTSFPKCKLLRQKVDSDIILKEHRVVFLEEDGIIVIGQLCQLQSEVVKLLDMGFHLIELVRTVVFNNIGF